MARTQVRGTTQVKADSVSKVETDATVITADGAAAFTANQPMGGHRATGAGDPVSAQDYVTLAFMVAAIAVAVDTTVCEPLTNGNPTAPELIYDSFGDVIMVKKVY